MDFRFRGKSGHAVDITAMTDLDPQATSVKLKFRGAAVLCYPILCPKHRKHWIVERREFITLCVTA